MVGVNLIHVDAMKYIYSKVNINAIMYYGSKPRRNKTRKHFAGYAILEKLHKNNHFVFKKVEHVISMSQNFF